MSCKINKCASNFLSILRVLSYFNFLWLSSNKITYSTCFEISMYYVFNAMN